ncbi:MAG: aminotransferase class III-fold pyridoxal phosphate-dependent enzyme [Acidobacteria bacterium]|nr:aminotransferase class III-fold pyridoxal phosphate-dependent enzyme [Acidobacteriota bacterium]
MLTTSSDPIALDQRRVLQVYKRLPVVFESGRGCALYTRDGQRYLDLISGVGVASLGHAHPALARAIADQGATLLHTSNLFHHPLQSELAARLADLSGLSRAFFCNSGAEAVEACLKFARRYWHAQGQAERTAFVALDHSFHGRTMGAVSVTWDPHYREQFGPLVPGVTCHGGRDHRRLPRDRNVADCRRSAVRTRPDRPSVLLAGARPAAGSDGHWQGARRRRPDRGGALLREDRQRREARRSRQHVRRQPAGVPRRAGVPARADRPRAGRSRRERGLASRGRAAPDGHAARWHHRRPRRRLDVGHRIGSARGVRRPGGVRSASADQPHVGHRGTAPAAVRDHRAGNR